MLNGQKRECALWAGCISLGLTALAAPAGAVTEPNGLQVPMWLTEDITQGVVDCCGVAADGSNISLDALFQSRNEAIDWLADAATEPSYFSPLCGFRGTLILRGGGCRVDFGWYNVDLNNPAPPPDHMIYPLVSIADVTAWFTVNNFPGGVENAFHPAVGEPPIEGQMIENLRADPRYTGGLIGLATVGNDIASPPQCTQTHYSEARLNQMSAFPTPEYPNGAPWIMALMYRSTQVPNAFYVAFEDLPTAPNDFQLLTSRGYFNDGDFNDFVYFVEGVTCEGGGQPCLVSAEGACGYGLTECQPDGTVQCVPQLEASPETCDNIDNDCNGLVDEGDGLCPEAMVCDKGVCRPNCSGGEFPCQGDLQCNADGLCVDPGCLDVACEPGQICIGGTCQGGCNNVVCPWGQICQLGRCVDPCATRECAANMVCEGGVCIESCHCRVCGPGLSCDYDTGECVAPGCEGGAVCGANEVCLSGAAGGECVNKCNNVLCPGGAACDSATGMCADPVGGAPTVEPWEIFMLPDGGLVREYPDGAMELVEVAEDGSLVVIAQIDPAVGPYGGSTLPGDPGTPGNPGATPMTLPESKSGCNCRATRHSGGTAEGFGLLLAALGLSGLRRRRKQRQA